MAAFTSKLCKMIECQDTNTKLRRDCNIPITFDCSVTTPEGSVLPVVGMKKFLFFSLRCPPPRKCFLIIPQILCLHQGWAGKVGANCVLMTNEIGFTLEFVPSCFTQNWWQNCAMKKLHRLTPCAVTELVYNLVQLARECSHT